MTTTYKDCFYSPKDHTIIDIIVNGVGAYSKEPLDLVKVRHPNAEIWDFEKACTHKEGSFLSDTVEITEEQYWNALECLPPLDWQRELNSESFKCMEMTSGRITAIYARQGKRYYSFSGFCTMSHSDIMDKVNRELTKHPIDVSRLETITDEQIDQS